MGTTAPGAPGIMTAPAGPAEPVPVAFCGRTSTLALQDPRASLRRQIRASQDKLPPGFVIAAYFWDIESGGIDLEARSRGDAYHQFTDAGIPRDGGMADLIAEATSPAPRFAAVICEDIERSGRDTYNALKLEKELSRTGIPIFAADEPIDVKGVNATTILVRRVKQGVAEWFRLQIREKAWKGLQEHSLDGWNIGPVPYGYRADRVPHPVPVKASQGRTKTRLAEDPEHGPVITQMFTWRVRDKLAVSTITARLAANPARYPSPDGKPWSIQSVFQILRNPKYTGYMVYGRTRKVNGHVVTLPPCQWIWSPEPTHPALTGMETWQAAQAIGAERGNIRDNETATTQPGRRYKLRARVRCNACKRRMHGLTRKPSGRNPEGFTVYKCPHKPNDPRDAAAHPDHGWITVSESTLDSAIAQFMRDRVFGPDRAVMLAAQLPATAAGHAEQQHQQAEHIRKELARIDTAQASLFKELEQLGTDASPATQAYRARIRTRHAELHDERVSYEQQQAALQAAATQADDPSLLDELPLAAALFDQAPDHIKERLYDVFDIHVLYRDGQQQFTIWATITDATPLAIAALLTDPRTDHDTQEPANPGRVDSKTYSTYNPS